MQSPATQAAGADGETIVAAEYSEFAALLASYPRRRPALTAAHERVYAQQYQLNRDGARPVERLAQYLERWMHRQVAAVPCGPLLELGAGTLNHRKYEAASIDYDVVEPFHALYEGRAEVSSVRAFFSSIADVPASARYKRIVSVAVLEHMECLPGDIAKAALRLDDDGVFQAGIPSEGGLLWWAGWRFSTGISYFLRTGLDYGVVMRHEHLNTAPEIIAIVRRLFEEVAVRRFPWPGHHSSFYAYVEARRPRRLLCEQLAAHYR